MSPFDVLIATDDPLRGLVLASQVTALGHRPVGPATARSEAVALARGATLDLAMLDEDSWPDARPVAPEISRFVRVPLILLVQHGFEETRPTYTAMAHVLTKPVSVEDVEAAIPAARRRLERWRVLERVVATLDGEQVLNRAVRLVAREQAFSRSRAEHWLEVESDARGQSIADLARTVVTADAMLGRTGTG